MGAERKRPGAHASKLTSLRLFQKKYYPMSSEAGKVILEG